MPVMKFFPRRCPAAAAAAAAALLLLACVTSPRLASAQPAAACTARCSTARDNCVRGCQSSPAGNPRAQCEADCRTETFADCVAACSAPLPAPSPGPPLGSVEVELAWDKIKAFANGEAFRAEPYMWTVFFKIDASNSEIVNGPSGIKLKAKNGATFGMLAGNGRHGNLPKIKDDQVKRIGSRFTYNPVVRPHTPFPGIKVAIVGSISVLLEEDGVPGSAATAAARTFRDEIEKQLKTLVNDLSISPAGVTLPQNLGSSLESIQKAIIRTIKDQTTFLQTIKTALLSPDDFIGSQVVLTVIADGVSAGLLQAPIISIPQGTAKVPIESAQLKGSGRWQLFGYVRRVRNN